MEREQLREKISGIISSEWSGNTKLNAVMELIELDTIEEEKGEDDWKDTKMYTCNQVKEFISRAIEMKLNK